MSRLNLVSMVFSGEEVFGNRDSGLTVKLRASGRGTRARGIGGSSIASLVLQMMKTRDGDRNE